jgi:FixJ family two-component response regulator
MGDATVGVIDDDQAVRRGLVRMLTACGFLVEAYESATEFLQQATPDAVDCLLVDVRMPEMTGFEFREHLTQRGYDLPIIFITGDDDTVASEASQRDGIRILVKPFDEDSLLAAIDDVLRDKAAGRHGPPAS